MMIASLFENETQFFEVFFRILCELKEQINWIIIVASRQETKIFSSSRAWEERRLT